jgi:hypothetical protein
MAAIGGFLGRNFASRAFLSRALLSSEAMAQQQSRVETGTRSVYAMKGWPDDKK